MVIKLNTIKSRARTSLSHLVVHVSFIRLSMKGKFDVYSLRRFGKIFKHALILANLQ